MDTLIGEFAALITAFCYAASSSFFTEAGKRLTSQVANRARLVTAVLLLIMVHYVTLDKPLPIDASADRWLWLGLSGIIGLAIGDAFLFQAYVIIGPRMGLLLLSLSPAIAVILAWFFLDEKLSLGQALGILVTLAGIIWVVLDHRSNGNANGRLSLSAIWEDKHYRAGLLFGLGGAVGQAFGLTLAKKGLAGDFPAISANMIRMSTAMLALWGFTVLQGEIGSTINKIRTVPKGLWFILAGSIIGPVLGVSFSLFSIQHTSVGVASTIIALPPVILLPVGRFVFKEQFGWGAVLGTLLAVVGVAILFLF